MLSAKGQGLRHSRVAQLSILTVAVAAAIALSRVATSSPDDSRVGKGVNAGQAQSLTGDESPIGGGRIVDLPTAQAEMKFDLLIPDSDVASRSSLTEVWSEPEEQEVGLVFQSGENRLVVDLYPAYLEDPKANYQAEIDLHIAEQSLTEVLGQPAIMTEPYTDVPKTNPAWLQFDLDGVDVNLFSFEYSTAELVDVATTLLPLAEQS